MDWKKDKVTVKVLNMERPGEDIFVSVNGVPYLIQHGETVTVPRAVVNVIGNAIKGKWKIEGKEDSEKSKTRVEIQRYMAVMIDDPLEDKEEKVPATKKGKNNLTAMLADAKKSKVEDDVE